MAYRKAIRVVMLSPFYFRLSVQEGFPLIRRDTLLNIEQKQPSY
ncbi:hypothetical protein GKODMF_06060 [Candidatus Electrothrix gigas]|jgi:hypothetical protein